MTARSLAPLPLSLVLALCCAALLRADLAQVKAEANLEKRSKLALDYADQTLKAARSAYDGGESDKATKLIAEVGDSVDLARTSLQETGKNPRKSPKYFKHAEIATRALLKRIEAFQDDMNVADRPMLDALRTRVQQVHDDLLMGIMEGKRK
jgi:hypothetical protein